MPHYNPTIHQRKSIRLKGYDYAQAGLYFITICVQNKACLFGNIVNNEMILNEYGQIAHAEWIKTAKIRPYVELGEFIVMPNHLHGIICLSGRGVLHTPKINAPETNATKTCVQNEGVCNTPLRSSSQTIGAILRGYKSAVTKQLGLFNFNQKFWQRNYYEHIIRNEQSHQRIADYIINNPAKWTEDKFYTE